MEGAVATRPELRISMLGRFAVRVGGHALADERWKLRKAKQLVKILALAEGQRLEKDRLLDLLWPELDPAAADNSFRQTVFVARRALDPVEGQRLFQRTGDAVELCSGGPVWTDVEAFRDLARRARASRTIAGHEAALAAYTGDLLPEDAYEDWGAPTREELRELRGVLMLELGELCRAAGRVDDAVNILEQLVSLQPTHEAAHVALMRIHASAGQRRRALRQYEVLAEALKRELDTRPEPSTRVVYEQILADRPTPAAGSVLPHHRRRHNLPAQLTTFIGRGEQVAQVTELTARSRLVTLVGPPGTGKTRLALAVAERKLDAHRHGVWIVDVRTLRASADLPDAIVAAMGASAEMTPDRLRDRQILVVLDACELLARDIGLTVTALLRASPRVAVLATSRETLHAEGEVVFDVPPLALPGPRDEADLDRAIAFDAMRLFAERAALARPGLEIGPKDLPAVLEICRRLDGLPLAIELAAAQVRTLSVQQVAARLDRTASSPQRRLHAAIEQSLANVSDTDRLLFARLGAFRRTFSLEAVEAVAADLEDVGDGLWRLVDKSLVRAVAADDGSIRFAMLDTIRDFAGSLLEASAERDAVRARHARFYADLAIAAAERGERDQTAWFDRLEREHDELRAAQDHVIATRDADLAVRLAYALGPFFHVRGHLREGRERIARALVLYPHRTVERVKALSSAATLAHDQADNAAVDVLRTELLSIARELDDPKWIAKGLFGLGWLRLQEARDDEAIALYREVLGQAERSGDPYTIAQAQSGLGNTYRHMDRLPEALHHYERALERCEEAQSRTGIARCQFMIGTIRELAGDAASARDLFERSLALNRELGDVTAAYVLGSLARLDIDAGDLPRARERLGEALAMVRDADERLGLILLVGGTTLYAWHTGRVADSVRLAAANDAYRARSKIRQAPGAERTRRRMLTEARAALGDAKVDALWAEGEKLPFEWAVEEAERLLG